MTELIVSLSVIAIVIGLSLPAVQAARSAMLRSACLNNLRQLGIATHAYEQGQERIPLGICAGLASPRRFYCFSAQAKLLPYLEADALAQAIDWTDESPDFPGTPPQANSNNVKLLTYRVPFFLCPADPNARDGANSYRQSIGWNVLLDGKDPLPSRFAGFGDGLSNTALFSERLVGGPPLRDRRNALIVLVQPHLIAPACAQVQLPPASPGALDPFVGATWLSGSYRHVRYAHMFPPNSRLYDCDVGGWTGLSLMTARSAHPGGVNLLFADGHCQFVEDGIDLKVWRAWGTPNGGEVLP